MWKTTPTCFILRAIIDINSGKPILPELVTSASLNMSSSSFELTFNPKEMDIRRMPQVMMFGYGCRAFDYTVFVQDSFQITFCEGPVGAFVEEIECEFQFFNLILIENGLRLSSS